MTDSTLAALWFADLAGFSDLASRDEDAAMRVVEAFQETVRETVETRGGRVVKWIGDGAMAAFPSTRAAMAAAMALRQEFPQRLSEGVALPLRIGVHVGDVVGLPDGDLYGDGVNMASRLQTGAEPGQILVSEDVWRQMRQRPGFAFLPVGEKTFKGTGTIEVYELLDGEESKGSRANAPLAVAESAEPSIAVLPFLNMSSDLESAYFADGVTEDIITALARIHGVKVISRTSAMRYRNTTKSLREIGAELGVATILEGSVRRQGDRVRIAAQLNESRTDAHIWADTYDRGLEDIFAIQTEVASQIASALQVSLSPGEQARISGRRTENGEAYELYLQGRHEWNQRRRESLEKAIDLFERAIEVDPDFPLAYTGLADVYAVISTYAPLPPRVACQRAAEAAQRALAIDPLLGEAHAVLGSVAVAEWHWDEAETHYRRALELAPGYATAHQWFGECCVFRGRIGEAIERLRRAQELNPHSLIIKTAVARPFLATGRYGEAVRQLERVLAIAPDDPHAHALLTVAYHAMGRYEESLSSMVQSMIIPWLDARRVEELRTAYLEGGKDNYLRQAARAIEENGGPARILAALHAGAGHLDRAFEVLERACEEHDPDMRSLRAEPMLALLHEDPRFEKLLERVGLCD
jgi:TolB-like protein/class 3 adenylate cyclase